MNREIIETKSVILTQTKIIGGFFCLLIFGLLFLFYQNYQNSKKLLVIHYSEELSHQVTLLNDSIDRICRHTSMLKSAFESVPTTPENAQFIKKRLSAFRDITTYHPRKNYHVYKLGKWLGHHQILSTIYSVGKKSDGGALYDQLVFNALKMQTIQASYVKSNPNIALSYYISEKNSFSQVYPPIKLEELIEPFDSAAQFISHVYDNYRDMASINNNPELKPFWTSPYRDPAGNGLMVTYTIPVDNGTGVVGADIILNFLSRFTHDLNIPGTAAIVTADNTVISATNFTYEKDGDLVSLSDLSSVSAPTFPEKRNCISIQNLDGKLFFSTRLNGISWKYLFIIDQKTISSAVFSELKWFAFVILLLIIILPLFFLLIFRKLIKPGIIADQELKHLNAELDNLVIERTKALKESEEYNKALFENSRIPLIVMDIDTFKFIDYNSAAVKIYGFRNEDAIKGKTPIDVSFATQYDGTPSEELAVEYIDQAIAGDSVVFEWKHQRPSGEVWDAEVQLMPIVIKDKKYLLFSLLDITQRKKMEAERKQLDEQLAHSHKMDAIGQLAGGVAHDFNNVLSGIMGAAQLLTNPARQLDKKGLTFVDMILNASSRAADLTQKLLIFARKGSSSVEPLGITAVVEETLDFLQVTIDKRVTISTEISVINDVVVADHSEIQNALMNLCINASHAMPDGGKIVIRLHNAELDGNYCHKSLFPLNPGQFVVIEISDQGIGIDPAYIERIFDPFFTTKGQGEGTGLGLASVYGTIQRYHGAITVESQPGVGSTFTLYLPCSTERIEELQNSPKESSLLSSGRVLLVDDEEIIRLLGQALLEEMGYDVLVAADGADAIKIYEDQHNQIDLVIMDMVMPKMTGATAFYKMMEIAPDSRIIISSGFTKGEDIDQMKTDGLAGFIQKPYNKDQLAELLSTILTKG